MKEFKHFLVAPYSNFKLHERHKTLSCAGACSPFPLPSEPFVARHEEEGSFTQEFRLLFNLALCRNTTGLRGHQPSTLQPLAINKPVRFMRIWLEHCFEFLHPAVKQSTSWIPNGFTKNAEPACLPTYVPTYLSPSTCPVLHNVPMKAFPRVLF